MARRAVRLSVLSFRLLVPLIGTALIFAGAALVREFQRRQSITREVRAIADEVARLEHRRERLTATIQRADSPEFLEREARLRFGLQKPGETVFIIRDLGGVESPNGQSASAAPPPTTAKRWWQHFFD